MSDKTELRTLLETTRADYRDLVASLSREDWKKRAPGQAWSNGELCFHMAVALSPMARTASRLRLGKGSNPPAPILKLMNPVSAVAFRFLGRNATQRTVVERYNKGHQRAVQVLESVQDADWSRGAMVRGEHHTVRDSFRFMREHFEEHRDTIQRTLG